MKRTFVVITIMGLFLFSSAAVRADEADIFMSKVQPNILFILDNSNSMDEDFFGNAVGSFALGSKSVEAKKALRNIVDTYVNKMRLGLMAYNLQPVTSVNLSNSAYFASYEPRSYCPNPPADCNNYCITGDVASRTACQSSCQAQNSSFDATYLLEIDTLPVGNSLRTSYCPLIYPKTNRVPNPTDMAHYIYYKKALPFYGGGTGNEFDYSPGYSLATQSAGAGAGPYNTYNQYYTKTGTSDVETGYLNYFGGAGFVPTDSDIALGYRNFGQRLFSYYVGPTWFANSSPAVGGYLHVAANTNDTANNNQRDALRAKLDPKDGDPTGYMSCGGNTCAHIVNAGLTPTAGTLQSAIDYFKGSSSPITEHCQKNFIVYATDGLPSVNEGGGVDSAANLIGAVNTKLTTLNNGITKSISSTSYNFITPTYILGMGLNDNDKSLLDSMAVAGGTAVNGHAYFADNSTQLTDSLNTTLADILERAFSFTTTSVASSRIADENYLYEASFEPVNYESFWRGHIKKYNIDSLGAIGVMEWDAGLKMKDQSASSRNIMTYKSGSLVSFQTANISRSDLGVATDAQRDAIVGYIRGDSTNNPEAGNWKLGDVFHSNIISIGTPATYFNDTRDQSSDTNGRNAFAAFRALDSNKRTSANGKRVLIAGANDGQFHAIKASDGTEYWSFVPPNFLPKLQYLAHSTHPTDLAHQYFADGPVVVSDAWLGSGDGKSKSVGEWKTLAVLSLGRNDNIYDNTEAVNSTKFWSSSASCDAGFSSVYNGTSAPYFCGYYAFDFTDTLSPAFKWRLSVTSTTAPYLGEPWGKMAIGRVIIAGNERWVGFIGGGYNYCNGSNCSDSRGKGFFVVDLRDGTIIWSYTGTTFSIPSSPAIVDTDGDGFIDTAYVGDMGGNMWRFKFCTPAQAASCNPQTDWAGGKLYSASVEGPVPVFTSITGSKDTLGHLWIYWGTGDKVNPTSANGGKFYALQDDDRTATYTRNDLKNISSDTFNVSSDAQKGWYINLPNTGEKALADPIVFGGVLYFTSYIPYLGTDKCLEAGTGRLYGVNYITGAPASGNSRKLGDDGTGLATAPIVSISPTGTADLYVTFSGGGSAGTGIDEQIRHMGNIPTEPIGNKVIYWKDRRVQ
jgi:type IV pilus assembly protein PilY1